MKQLTPKTDSTAGAAGQYTAAEFNDFHAELEGLVTESGQTLDEADTRQVVKALAAGGKPITRTTGQTALIGEVVYPNNSAGAVTINLPSAGLFVGATVVFRPTPGQPYSTYGLTVGRSGNNIMSLAEDLTLNSDGADGRVIALVWVGGSIGWSLSVTGEVGA